MATPVSDNLRNNSNKLLDEKEGPYYSKELACIGVPLEYRAPGQTVKIWEGIKLVEYWWPGPGLEDGDLVKKAGLNTEGIQDGQLPVWSNPLQAFVFKFAQELEQSPPIALPHTLVRQLQTNPSGQPKLTIGKYYKVTDHETIHIVTNSPAPGHLNVGGYVFTDKTLWQGGTTVGVVEPLVLLAATESTFSPIAYSELHPTDIIKYDIADVLCEDGVTPRRGKITERISTLQELYAGFDFRNVKHFRCALNPPAYDPATPYVVDNTVEYNNAVYVCTSPCTGVTPSNAATNHNWALVLSFGADAWGRRTIGRYLGISGPTTNIGGRNIAVNTADFRHYSTFNKLENPDTEECSDFFDPARVFNVKIGKNPGNPYNNHIFATPWIAANTYQDIKNFDIDFNTSNASFVCGGTAFSMKQSCSSVILRGPAYGFYLGQGNSGWYIDTANGFHPTDISSDALVRNVIFHRGIKSHFEQDCFNIIAKGELTGSTIGPGTSATVFHASFNTSRILLGLSGCTFKGAVSRAAFVQQLQGVTFEGTITAVTFVQRLLNITIAGNLADTVYSPLSPKGPTPFAAVNTFDSNKIMFLGGAGDPFNANHVLTDAASGNSFETYLTVYVAGNGSNTVTIGTGWTGSVSKLLQAANGTLYEIIMRRVNDTIKTFTIRQLQ